MNACYACNTGVLNSRCRGRERLLFSSPWKGEQQAFRTTVVRHPLSFPGL